MRLRISATDHGGGLIRAASLCAALAACAAMPALAGEPPASEPVQASAEADVVPGAGMRVAVDPTTGMPRPLTAEEARVLDAMAARSRRAVPTPALQSFKAKGGAVGVKLDPSYMVYSVATVGEDGKVRMDCVTGAEHADDAVHDHAQTDSNDHQEASHATR
jgi:hypothetical protein